ncbi:helix-turn-helix transcriptional regulator [Streptomyces sp. SID11385]|uniref:helix-turn-helix domain-containing protein n=1 Tax=Streptomyces sp. SID11385 TaxID=2706031 RepID=UPI0013C9288C|nr:helix-turn-helix transcriptional regulator [Streptomyces sp. SID11385]NEA42899.1 helix-turn-helix transcriptional regulator [Streptomyces sp. SID11385]
MSAETVTVELPAGGQPDTIRSADTPLGRARVARGWSQAKAVRALSILARHWGWQIASEASLKVLLSCWESGKRTPSETYVRLFCALYRATPEDLGFVVRDSRVVSAPGTVASVQNAVTHLAAQLAELQAVLASMTGAAS